MCCPCLKIIFFTSLPGSLQINFSSHFLGAWKCLCKSSEFQHEHFNSHHLCCTLHMQIMWTYYVHLSIYYLCLLFGDLPVILQCFLLFTYTKLFKCLNWFSFEHWSQTNHLEDKRASLLIVDLERGEILSPPPPPPAQYIYNYNTHSTSPAPAPTSPSPANKYSLQRRV